MSTNSKREVPKRTPLSTLAALQAERGKEQAKRENQRTEDPQQRRDHREPVDHPRKPEL